MAEREIVAFESAAEWEAWLERNHERPVGVWVRIAKKESGLRSVSYAEALDGALCYGWIDGQKAKGDESWWLQYFCRRKPGSLWSKVNRTNVDRLSAAGRMRAPGLAAVERAKGDGRWDAAYQPAGSREVPPELARALEGNPAAAAFFESLRGQDRYAFVFRVATTKNEALRREKAERFAAMLARGETLRPAGKP